MLPAAGEGRFASGAGAGRVAWGRAHAGLLRGGRM